MAIHLLQLALGQGSPEPGLQPILVAIGGMFTLALGFIALLLFSQRRVMEAARTKAEAQTRLLEAAEAGNLMLWTAEEMQGSFSIGGSAKTLLGIAPASLESLIDLVVPTDQKVARSLVAGVKSSEKAPQVLHMKHQQGHILETQWQVRCHDGRLEGVIRDITRESQLQAQLIQSQKLEAVGTLVAGVSHEFGNLLAIMESCVDFLVGSEDLSEEENQAARHIQDASLRGKDLIRQLLTFARRGLGEVIPEDPQKLLEEMQQLIKPIVGRRIQLEVETTPGLPPYPMNRAQILQALLNLCLNAKAAMPRGGLILLRAYTPRGADGLILEVEDQGPGVPAELQTRIFEPFFTTKEPGKGTGLGLAMTLSIVQAHGGTIVCDQGDRGGAVFRINLPPASPPGIEDQIGD